MTLSTSCPAQLDLASLTAAQQVAIAAIQDLVCEWEQSGLDAAANGDYRSAQQYRDWAFAGDLARYKVVSALGALFIDTLDTLRLVEDYRQVQLPDLGRSDQDRYLDALQVEVASHQPEG